MITFEDFIKTGYIQENNAVFLDNFFHFTEDSFIDGSITLDLSEFSYIEIKLILKNAKFHGEYEDGFAYFDDIFIEKNSVGFVLKCQSSDNYITFEDFEYTAKPLKVPFNIQSRETPWKALFRFATCIYEKVKLFNTDLSEKERALEPMLRDFYELKFETLKSRFPNDKKLAKLIGKVQKDRAENIGCEILGDNELEQYLSKPEFESAWRKIFDLLLDSQKEYVHSVILNDSEDLNKFRSHIHSVMIENGYTGEYPNYRKTANAKGFHWVFKNGKITLIGGKTITVFAEFNETEYMNFGYFEPRFYITFQDPESIKDKYSCLFSEKGFVKTANLNFEVEENGKVHFEHGYLNFPEILCKTAESKRLTAEEKKFIRSYRVEMPVLLTVAFSLICSLIVGIVTVLGFILVEFIIVLLFGKISLFPEIFIDTPWHFFFLFASLLTFAVVSLILIIPEKLRF